MPPLPRLEVALGHAHIRSAVASFVLVRGHACASGLKIMASCGSHAEDARLALASVPAEQALGRPAAGAGASAIECL
eukprot:1515620-Pleurochrysis_carterae.AAC.1